VDLPKLLLHEREDRLNGEGGDFNSNAELPMNTTTMAYNASGWQYVELPSEHVYFRVWKILNGQFRDNKIVRAYKM
jgi:hypothetical protein